MERQHWEDGMNRRYTLFLLLILCCAFGVIPARAAGPIHVTAVYLGVQGYGTAAAADKDSFRHRFFVNGTEEKWLVSPQDHYAIQNRLQEGYVYDVTVRDSTVIAAEFAAAAAEGRITAANPSTVTIDEKTLPVTGVYEIFNRDAGCAAVVPKTAAESVGKTAKVYGDTVYLSFLAEDYHAPVYGVLGRRTLKNLLETALEPVGTTLYVYGGAWDWQDVQASNQARTLGLPQSWVDFFQQQDAGYQYKKDTDPAHSFYPFGKWNAYYYAGADCSGYLGWVLYQVLNTEDSPEEGEVAASTTLAGNLAARGLGTLTRSSRGDGAAKPEFQPGDIFSLQGHVWLCLGVCNDGSIVLAHSTPSRSKTGDGCGGGVQLSALNPESDMDPDCEAYRLAQMYMNRYYPAWSVRYDAQLYRYRVYAALAENQKSGRFRWNQTVLTDPDGYTEKSAAEILEDLFHAPANAQDILGRAMGLGTLAGTEQVGFAADAALMGTQAALCESMQTGQSRYGSGFWDIRGSLSAYT